MCALGALNPFARVAMAEEMAAQGESHEYLTDRYYIFCYFGGGWDILLSLDPRDPVAFNAETMATTRIQPGYTLLDDVPEAPVIQTAGGLLGFCLGDLATQHQDKISIVRGINMETLSHAAGKMRFLTGKEASGVQARGSSVSTWLTSFLGEQETIPHLAVNLATYNKDRPNFASGIKVSTVSDLLEAIRADRPFSEQLIDQQIEALLHQDAQCTRALISRFSNKAESARQKSLEMVSSGLGNTFDFLANNDEMAAVRTHYGFAKNTNGLSTPGARAALAAKAVTSGVSRVVSVTLNGGFDTHGLNWRDDQPERQQAGFNAIARLIEDLSATEYKGTGTTWMDHTNIIAFSEFSRTSMLNQNSGRDHWLNNACLVAGADIKGGKFIGASSDNGMQPQGVNLETGLVDNLGGVTLNPEHVLQTFLHAIGYRNDPADLRVDPIKALMKNS